MTRTPHCRLQHPMLKVFDDANMIGESEFECTVSECRSMGVGDTLWAGQMISSEEGSVDLRVDEKGSIVIQQVLHVYTHKHTSVST